MDSPPSDDRDGTEWKRSDVNTLRADIPRGRAKLQRNKKAAWTAPLARVEDTKGNLKKILELSDLGSSSLTSCL